MANQQVTLDPVFHALADPTRRAVIQRLGRGTATVSELARPFDMALPSFMKHLDVLERSRLIVSRKAGRVRTCELQKENLLAAQRWFDEQRRCWQGRYDNLDGLLAKLSGDEHDT
jgi:DNA-binding transcriptional ArsR family regulator